MNKIVVFYPRAEAEHFVPQYSDVIISIHDRHQPPAVLQAGWENVLLLSFHDVDVPEHDRDLFSADQAQQVIDFIHDNANAKRIIVHCNMGVSRSAGIALFISEQQERQLFQQGRALYYPEIPKQYNRLVYSVLNTALMGNAPSAFESLDY